MATGSGPLKTVAAPSARLSHIPTGWRFAVRNPGQGVVTGDVSSDGQVIVLDATERLRSVLQRTRHAFSFRLAGTSSTQRIDFRLRCASRISAKFSGETLFIGSRVAPAPSFQLQRPSDTGIAGNIIAGPTCPIVTPSCPPGRPVPGTVVIQTAPTSRDSAPPTTVKSVASDANGNFSTDLSPGEYLIYAEPASPQPPSPSGSSTSRAATVRVAAGVVTQVTLVFDTGIR